MGQAGDHEHSCRRPTTPEAGRPRGWLHVCTLTPEEARGRGKPRSPPEAVRHTIHGDTTDILSGGCSKMAAQNPAPEERVTGRGRGRRKSLYFIGDPENDLVFIHCELLLLSISGRNIC